MNRNPSGRITTGQKRIRILLAPLIIILFYLVTVPVSREVLFYPKSMLSPKIVIGFKIKELGDNEFSAIDVPQWQQDYYSKFNIPPVVVSLDYIYVPQNPQISNKELCIGELNIKHFVPNRYQFTESNLLKTTSPICLDLGMTYFVFHESKQKAFIYNRHLDPFWYPFDYRSLDFEILVDGSLKGKELGKLDYVVDIVSIPPRWVSWIVLPKSEDKLDIQNVNLSVYLTRPLLYPLLSVLVPFTVFMLLVRILPNVARERGSFWEITVGLILGLWGFSEVLIPGYINFPTLIGYVILSLYIPLVFFVRYISLTYKRRPKLLSKTNGIKKRNPNY
jgi:hypothetical protein